MSTSGRSLRMLPTIHGSSLDDADWNVPDHEPPGHAAPHPVELVVHPVDLGEHRAGVVDEQQPGGREFGGPGALGPIEDGKPGRSSRAPRSAG